MPKMTHINSKNMPEMVDVSEKPFSFRKASARAIVTLPSEFDLFETGKEIQTPKGAVISTAIIAGTFGAKQTSALIPFCHNLSLDDCKFSFLALSPCRLEILCSVKTRASTGVEMEAITGVTIAAVTVYDMCKSLTPNITIGSIELMEKSGGKNDFSRYQ